MELAGACEPLAPACVLILAPNPEPLTLASTLPDWLVAMMPIQDNSSVSAASSDSSMDEAETAVVEMLLEAYFMYLDSTFNRLQVRARTRQRVCVHAPCAVWVWR